MKRTGFRSRERAKVAPVVDRQARLDERSARTWAAGLAAKAAKKPDMPKIAAAFTGAADSEYPIVSVPKSAAQRNAHLRDMARGMPCLLRVPGVCTQDRATVVCCHSNLSIHGKAGARKADDHYSVWGCAACHSWLDRGPAPRAQKASAFMAAHLAQVLEWRAIAFDSSSQARDRAAALWALERLNATRTDGQMQANF